MEKRNINGKRLKNRWRKVAQCGVKGFFALWKKYAHLSRWTNGTHKQLIISSRSRPLSPVSHQLAYLALTLMLLLEVFAVRTFGILQGFAGVVMVIPTSAVMFAKQFLKEG